MRSCRASSPSAPLNQVPGSEGTGYLSFSKLSRQLIVFIECFLVNQVNMENGNNIGQGISDGGTVRRVT